MLPIIDIAFNYLNNSLLKSNTVIADRVATQLVANLCSDDNADGVFFDLEISDPFSYPGLFEFYRQISLLFAKPPCVNSTHPKGRYLGIYITPVNNDWSLAQAIFSGQNNGYLAIPLYDVKGFSTPPTPDPLSLYTSYVTSAIQSAASKAVVNKVPYTIIVPAAASFGTFMQYGIYNSSEPAPTYFNSSLILA